MGGQKRSEELFPGEAVFKAADICMQYMQRDIDIQMLFHLKSLVAFYLFELSVFNFFNFNGDKPLTLQYFVPHNSNSLKDIFECKAQKLTTNSAAHSHLTSLGLLVWAVIAFGANDNVSERVTERERENEMEGQRDRQGVRE